MVIILIFTEKSLHFVIGTNIVLEVSYISKTKKDTNSQKKLSNLWVPEFGGGLVEISG